MKIKTVIFTFFVFFLTGCASNDDTARMEKISKLHDLWALDSLNGQKILKESAEKIPYIELNVHTLKFLGITGCNDMSGDFTADESTITFNNFGMTKIFCPGTVESDFVNAIKKANKWIVQNAKLYLYVDDKCVMVFRRFD
jgi:heat shock protein HslJ